MAEYTEVLVRVADSIRARNAGAARVATDDLPAFAGETGTPDAAINGLVGEVCATAESLLSGDLDGVRTSLMGANIHASFEGGQMSDDAWDALIGVGEALYEVAPDNLPITGHLAMLHYLRAGRADHRSRAIALMRDLVTRLDAPDADGATGIEIAGVHLGFAHDTLAGMLLYTDTTEAAEHGRRALELAPELASEDCFLAQAVEAADRMDFDSALGFLARIQEYDIPSRRYLAESLRARWLTLTGRAEEAMAQLDSLEDSEGRLPDNPWMRELVLARAAACCELERDLERAVAECAELLRADPEDFDARVRLASALARSERLDEAREHIDYLLSLDQPDMILYFTAGVLYKVLGIRSKERGAGFSEIDLLYEKAMRYITGNGELPFMQHVYEEQMGYVGHLWGEAIYDEAARLGNGGNVQAALDLLHDRERRAFATSLRAWITLSLAEVYTVLVQNYGTPDYRRWATHYLDELARTDDVDQSTVATLRARLA
jgi:tetratricopeptide (TPR) repeat protein